jgi:D-sedoheptulose 7-phosphate isomerase
VDPFEYLTKTADETRLIQQTFLNECGKALLDAARAMGQCVRSGGKVLIFGNGGSAADAQHMAAEMVGRMLVEREPLPAIALTTDTSILTAVGNDYGYDAVFRRQVEALAKKGDVVIAISTSGNSRNVLLAVEAARALGCTIVGLTGGTGGKLKDCCDISLNVSKGTSSSRIQESHIFAVHSMVDLLDRFYLKSSRDG